MKNLGYMNEWYKEDLERDNILLECENENHELSKEIIGNCLTEYTCEICGYKYRVDSSG